MDLILKSRMAEHAILKFSELKKLRPIVEIQNLESFFRIANLSQADVRFVSSDQEFILACRIQRLETYINLASLSTGDVELVFSDQDIYLVCQIQPLRPFIPRPLDVEDMFQCIRKHVNGSFCALKWHVSEDDITSAKNVYKHAINQFDYFGRTAIGLWTESDSRLGAQLLGQACDKVEDIIHSGCPALLINIVDIVRLYYSRFPDIAKQILTLCAGLCNKLISPRDPLTKIFEQLAMVGKAEFDRVANIVVQCGLEQFDNLLEPHHPAVMRVWTTWAPRTQVDKGKLDSRIRESLRKQREKYEKGNKSVLRVIFNLAGYLFLNGNRDVDAQTLFTKVLGKSELPSQKSDSRPNYLEYLAYRWVCSTSYRQSNDLIQPLQSWTSSFRRHDLVTLVECLKELGEAHAAEWQEILHSLPEE